MHCIFYKTLNDGRKIIEFFTQKVAVHVIVLLLGILCGAESSKAEVFLVRDYPSGVTLSAGQIEVSLDWMGMNDTLDVFDIKDSRTGSVSQRFAGDNLGDLSGGQLLASYGLTDKFMLSGGYKYREVDITIAEFEIDTYELSLTGRHNFYARPDHDTAYAFASVGLRHNRCGDYATSDIDNIDYLLGKLSSRFSVTQRAGRIFIDSGERIYSSPLVDEDGTVREALEIGFSGAKDTTAFVRIGVGRRWERLNISLFSEVGYSFIDGEIDFDPSGYGIERDSSLLGEITSDLDREETYTSFGLSFYYETLFGIAATASYEYSIHQRDHGLDGYPDNHVIDAELIFRMTPNLALTLGGEYYVNQFNGVIPLLYNRYTESVFDHDYGIVKLGLSMVFGRPSGR